MALKVVGAGLGRTGTLSLKLALEQIGFGPCYHMVEVMMGAQVAVPLWMKAADGNPDWETTFNGYVATVDYPGCAFWQQLADSYPDAKVLLTVRDPDQWFESTQATIFSPESVQRMNASPMRAFMEQTVWKEFGDRIHDRDFMIHHFKQHNAAVERTIPKDRLLVYDVRQGWEPLCQFLNVTVPSTPFPRRNSREEMAAFIAANTADGGTLDMNRLQHMLKEHLGGS